MLKRITTFIKEEWKFLIFIVLLYFGLTYEFPYVIYTPGGAVNMGDRVEGDNLYNEEGTLSMTYVSMIRGTAPFLMLSSIMPNWDIVETSDITYDDVDLNETVEIDKIYMREAISNALYVAYTNANIDFKTITEHHIVTYISENAKTKLKYGDEILKIDGQEYADLKAFQKYVEAKKLGDIIEIEYQRNTKTFIDKVELIEIEGITKAGLSIATIGEYRSDYNIEITTKNSESGPSGGLMTALAVYNRISPNDITKGKTIMGTGTISKDGKVGEIGGVKYKLLGASKEGADVFMCPLENYEEAKEVKEKENLDIEVLGVSTFEDAIKALEKI